MVAAWPVALALALALLAVAGQPALAQDCPGPAQLQPRHLVGLWRAEFAGGSGATLLLEPHPRYAASLAGEVNRNGVRARVAGDLDEGEFTLEESADGVRIDAAWLGEVVEGSCGREIRGTWQATGATAARAFTLRRLDR